MSYNRLVHFYKRKSFWSQRNSIDQWLWLKKKFIWIENTASSSSKWNFKSFGCRLSTTNFSSKTNEFFSLRIDWFSCFQTPISNSYDDGNDFSQPKSRTNDYESDPYQQTPSPYQTQRSPYNGTYTQVTIEFTFARLPFFECVLALS